MSRVGSTFVLALAVFNRGAYAGFNDLVRFEKDHPVNANQKILSDRDGRFLRFDTKDTEIELELGVSVPFLKIPLHSGLEPSQPGAPPSDSRLALNPAGLLVGATLLLSTFLLVPLVIPANNENARSDSTLHKTGAMFSEINNFLKSHNLDVKSCSQKAVCELAAGTGILPTMLHQAMRIELVQNVLDRSSLRNAVESGQNGTCDESFQSCFLNHEHFANIHNFIGTW